MFSSVPHFLIGLFGILMSSLLSSLYIVEISPQSDVGLMNINFNSVGCLLSYWQCLLLYSFRRSHLFLVALSVCATGDIFRKQSPVPMH